MRLRPPPSVCRRVLIVGEATRYSPLQLNDLPKSAFAAALASAVSTPAATVTAVAAVTIAAGLTVATLSCGRRRRGFKRVGAEEDEDEDGVERDDQLEYF